MQPLGPVSRTPSRRSRRPGDRLGAPATVVTVVAVAAVVMALTSCSSNDPVVQARSAPRPTTTSTAPVVQEPAPLSPPPEPSPPPTSQQPPPETVPQVTALPTDQDGRIFAVLKGVDVDARTLTIDVAQYLGGDDHLRWLASDPARWKDIYCDSTESYYDGTQDLLSSCGSIAQNQTVVNESERLRTLSIADDATFAIPLGGDGRTSPVGFDAFADYLRNPNMGDTFWLTVRDGWIVDAELQFFS